MDGTYLRSIKGRCDTDILSYLPCNVIDNILKYLPLRDAVRTSILSRGRQQKWVTIPYLDFDHNFERSLANCSVESVIFQVLLLDRGPILRFKIEDLGLSDYCALHPSINFLSNHPLEVLILDTYSSPLRLMPSCLSSFHELRHLQLLDCALKLPLTFKGLNRLMTLDLEHVTCDTEDLERFISASSSLEHLRLWLLSYDRPLEIHASRLKSFTFSDRLDFVASISSPLPALFSLNTTLELDVVELYAREHDRKTVELLGQSNVRVDLEHQTLQASQTPPDMDTDGAGNSEKAEEESEPLRQLKTVKIQKFSGSRSEMEFLKFILSSAIVLEKMNIECVPNGKSIKHSKVLKKLVRLPRVSQKAEIIYQDHPRN